MEQNNQFTAMNDDELDQVAGGYLEVSKWRNYVTDTVVPLVNSMMNGASSNDRMIIDTVYGVFRATLIPGANISVPVRNLWNDFNLNYRGRLESQDIRNRLGQMISDARDYINRNA